MSSMMTATEDVSVYPKVIPSTRSNPHWFHIKHLIKSYDCQCPAHNYRKVHNYQKIYNIHTHHTIHCIYECTLFLYEKLRRMQIDIYDRSLCICINTRTCFSWQNKTELMKHQEWRLKQWSRRTNILCFGIGMCLQVAIQHTAPCLRERQRYSDRMIRHSESTYVSKRVYDVYIIYSVYHASMRAKLQSA